MIKKMLIVITVTLMLAAVMPASLAASEDIQPYAGWAGADSPLYGLKLLIQGFDESMAGNANAKLDRQMIHAEERLSEARAMATANNYGAMDAALCEYEQALTRINETMDDPSVDNATCVNMSLQLQKHQHNFKYMVNNSSLTEQSKNRWMNSFNYSEQFKNGRPFVYVNNTSYFLPPGQIGRGNQSNLPPGLGKKGYVMPSPENGAAVLPVDLAKNNSYNHKYNNTNNNGTGIGVNQKNYSYDNDYNNTYLSPGPHGNGNGNGNGKK